jgi:hypothetical protein
MLEQRLQLIDADAAMADHAQHVDAEAAAQRRQVELAAARLHLVDHGQHQQRGEPALERLVHEPEPAPQRGRIGHDQQRIGKRLAGDGPVQHPLHHLLVRRLSLERVGSRQVEDRDRAASAFERPAAPLHGDAGIVADAGGRAGERVEERRLARIRRADQRDANRGGLLLRNHHRCAGAGNAHLRDASRRTRRPRSWARRRQSR